MVDKTVCLRQPQYIVIPNEETFVCVCQLRSVNQIVLQNQFLSDSICHSIRNLVEALYYLQPQFQL